MGKTIWRSEPVWVENRLDELRIGVKGQSNSVIARTPRNVLRDSLGMSLPEVELPIGLGLSQRYQTQMNSECRYDMSGSEGMSDKVHVREGNNPELQLRPPSSG